MPLSKRTSVWSPTASAHSRQCVESCDGPVELAASVVGYDHAGHSLVHGPPRVVGVQDPLTSTGSRVDWTEPAEVVPGARRVGENLAEVFEHPGGVGLNFAADRFTEDRIAEIVRQSVAVEEGQKGVLDVAARAQASKYVSRVTSTIAP